MKRLTERTDIGDFLLDEIAFIVVTAGSSTHGRRMMTFAATEKDYEKDTDDK